MLTLYKITGAVFFILLLNVAALAEVVTGTIGYDNTQNSACNARNTIQKGEVKAESLVFWNGNRKWLWSSIVDSSLYYLEEIQPAHKHSVTGEIKWVADRKRFEGWIVDGNCGNGWIELQLKIK